ncbi:MAG TPA: hypothetical protein VFP54_02920 [Acidimicrobiales bacterium]|nr:hypothetical protein [Acidimicrobiales bacterium]
MLRSADLVLIACDFEAFPTGVAFTLVTKRRPGTYDPQVTWAHQQRLSGGAPEFGIGFSDGGRTRLHQPWGPSDSEPSGPRLSGRGGGGNPEEHRSNLWLWPLPPPGPVTLAARWEEGGIPEQMNTVSGEELIEAASRAEFLWEVPDDPAPGMLSFSTSSIARPDGQRLRPPTD